MVIHELGGIIFLVACIAHVILNWRPLVKTIGSRISVCAVLAVILLAGLGMAFSDVEPKRQHMMKKMLGETHLISR
jgi:putative copper export protein